MPKNDLSIGALKLSKPYVLAPLAGVSSYAFRMINRKFGCELAFTEMICARSLAATNKKTIEALHTTPDDRPLGVQLVGENIEYILRSMAKLEKMDYDILDFNSACPTRKVVNCGKGAALLKTPEKLRDILKTMVGHSQKPVTAKIRLGWDSGRYADEIARFAEDGGISALFVHGRTKVQGYAGEVDYPAIAAIKKALKIPVIASGNVFNAGMAKKMFDETGCDAIVAARGAFGNPWIFREIDQYLKTGAVMSRPSTEEVAAAMREHFRLEQGLLGPKRCVKIFRKFYIWYTKGCRNVKYLRVKASRVQTVTAMDELIDEFEASHKSQA